MGTFFLAFYSRFEENLYQYVVAPGTVIIYFLYHSVWIFPFVLLLTCCARTDLFAKARVRDELVRSRRSCGDGALQCGHD